MRGGVCHIVKVAAALAFFATPQLWAQPAKPDQLEAPKLKTPKEIDFDRDIRPIFTKHCLECHGADKQEGGLRLHLKSEALKGGDRGIPLTPGKSAESRLIQFVTGQNDDKVLMPPEGDGQRLTESQISQLRAWIDQGAKWPDDVAGVSKSKHWSFQPIARPTLPKVNDAAWVRNGIDAFVLAKLESQGIKPSPEADRATLIRRVILDLTGLPPTLAEIDAFEQSAIRNPQSAFEALVDRLLASPHYGERWGRHWLDLARYADSDGYEKDTARPFAWRWRNWVIEALNRDLPFDQFTVEQLAGDLLPNATLEQKIATGFHRNTLINKEGGVDQEEFRVKAVVDRVNTTGTVWLGLTVGCAQCHSHKYDPIAQREFYGLFAFFNSVSDVDIPAPLPEHVAEYQRAKAAFDAAHAPLAAQVAAFENEQLPARLAEWEKSASQTSLTWNVLTPVTAESAGKAKLEKQPDGSVLVSGKSPISDTYTLTFNTSLIGITAIRLETLADPSLPSKGPGRTAHGNFVLSEIRATVAPKNNPKAEKPVELTNAVADFAQGPDQQQFPASAALDGQHETGWAVAGQLGQSHVAVFEVREPAGFDGGSELTITLDQKYGGGHTIGRPRISITTSPKPVGLGGIPEEVSKSLAVSPAARTAAQQATILKHYRTLDPELAKLDAAVADHVKKAPIDPGSTAKAQAFAELPKPRVSHVLIRGDFLRKGAEVQPHTLAVLPTIATRDSATANRLDLARWLVDPENPLTSRVAVNRVWQHYFGRGLVATTEDFGTQGQPPSHPELLDWLAREFMQRGWSLKSLHKLIVTSAAYRQSSATRLDLLERDPQNVWLARQSRHRVEAEVIRDLSLAASGLLNSSIGGPSVRPPQPAGISELTYAGSAKWVESKGADRYRRGMYTHFQRTSPYPMLMTFDAPDSNVCAVRRERSNTPLQSLTLLNDQVFFECAQSLARRIVNERPAADASLSRTTETIRRGFRVCLAREPSAIELERLEQLFGTLLLECQKTPADAAKLAGKDWPKDIPIPEAAAWTMFARVLLNLDEFVTRE